jgi:hypothetical protein
LENTLKALKLQVFVCVCDDDHHKHMEHQWKQSLFMNALTKEMTMDNLRHKHLLYWTSNARINCCLKKLVYFVLLTFCGILYAQDTFYVTRNNTNCLVDLKYVKQWN